MEKIVRTPTFAGGGVTPEEKARMAAHSEMWIARALRTAPIEPNEIGRAIRDLYRVAGLKEPRVVVVPSPRIMAVAGGAAAAVWYARKNPRKTPGFNEIHAATRAATAAATVAATYAAIRDATYAATATATRVVTRDATHAATAIATRVVTRDATRAATRDATDIATAVATVVATRDATVAATYAATEVATHAATDIATYAAIRDAALATDAATRAATDAATYDATRDVTRDVTRDATHAATDVATVAATDAATRDATDVATRDATEVATAFATRDATVAATDDATYGATRVVTRDATAAATYDATRVVTEVATYAATRDATDIATAVATEVATHAATDIATADATATATRVVTRDATHAATYAATRDATYDATRAAIRAATVAATYAATRAVTDAATAAAIRDATYRAASSKGWIQFVTGCMSRWWAMYQGGNMAVAYDCYLTACRDVLGLRLPVYEKYDAWERAAIHGGFRMMHEEFCMVSDFPEVLKMDDRNRPHCEDGPSHKWRDGWSLYHWHGVRVPGEWIEDKGSLTPEMALKEQDIEKRRAACEIVGWARILRELNAKEVDRDTNPMVGTLLEVDLPDAEQERFLVVKCGTGREFAIPVPQEMRTAREANAWTYSLDANDYYPEVRT